MTTGERPEEEWLDGITDDGDVLGDRQTESLYQLPDLPTWRQTAGQPSWIKELLFSLPFYVLVMAIPTVGAWVLATKVPNSVTKWTAIGTTLCCAGLCILRVVRGNLIDAEREVAGELLEDKLVINNRLAKQLWDDEKVKWETRRHPISIIPTIIRRLTATKWRRRFTTVYLVVLGIAWYTSAWTGVLASLVGALAVSFTIMEWARVRYAFTSERIMAVEKLIGKSVPAMPRSKLTDIVVSEHWFAVLLAWLRVVRVPWGTWDVETAGQDQALKYIYYLPAAVIAAAVFSLGRSSGDDGT